MKHLSLTAALFFISLSTFASAQETGFEESVVALEKKFEGKIGLYAINTNNNKVIAHRADERFPFQSTFKLVGAAALLQKSQHDKKLLKEKIYYTDQDLVTWHPITGKFIKQGMTLEALSIAAVTYSDSTAINLIMKKFGGPTFINDFMRSIGNQSFNLIHDEPHLNSNPNSPDDTVTPKDMALTVEKLTLGNVLPKHLRAKLVTWMMNSTTSYQRFRVAAPVAWVVADKTGSGNYGVANDIGIMWSPACKPIILAIYTAGSTKEMKARDDIVAQATTLALNEFAKQDTCFTALS